MPVSTLVVTGGFWKGCELANCNIYIINRLKILGHTAAEKWLSERQYKKNATKAPDCIVCLDNFPIFLAQPCNHLLYCDICYSNSKLHTKKYPLCNIVVSFSRIFF